MAPLVIVSYLALCLMVGLLGRKSRLGFFRSVLFSVMLTPFIVTLYLLIFSTLEAEAKKD